MKRTKSHKLSLFLFYFYFLVQALSSPEEILNKYSSIKTTNNYAIVNITDFNYNDNIYLSLKSFLIISLTTCMSKQECPSLNCVKADVG